MKIKNILSVNLLKQTKLFLIVFSLVIIGCKNNNGGKMEFKLTAEVFKNGETIPVEYTCQGKDISPALNWNGIPAKAKSLVLIMEDPDAPDPKAPKITWIHWVLYNIPVSSSGLKKDVGKNGLPKGTLEGLNSWGKTGYGGPCPPIGRHRYFFKLYAINTVLPDLSFPTKTKLLEAVKDKIVAETELMGTYKKQK